MKRLPLVTLYCKARGCSTVDPVTLVAWMTTPIAASTRHILVTIWSYGNIEMRPYAARFAERALISPIRSLSLKDVNKVSYDGIAIMKCNQ